MLQDPSNPILSLPSFADNDEDEAIAPRRPFWRRRGPIIAISLLLLALILGGVALAALRGMRQTTTYQYQKVYQNNFALTVSATGPLQSGIYNVVFSGSGKLTEIDVKVGETVTQGQVLGKLDKTSLQDAVDQAQAAVLTAQKAVDNSQASSGSTQGQGQANVASAQTSLANAQAALTKIEAQSQASLNAAQTAIQNDQTNLTNTQTSSQASIASAQTALSNDQTNLSNTQASSQASINAAQTSLNDAQSSLQVTQNQAQSQINTAYTTEQNAISACNNSAATPTPNCVQLAQQQYQQTVSTANASVNAAQAKVNESQAALNTARTQANSNIADAQAKVTSDQAALRAAQVQAASNISTAQAKITTDQKQLTVTQAQVAANNTNAQGEVSTAQSQLNTANANANASETTASGQVDTAQGQLNTALVQLQTAQHNLDNATLRAPHAGIIAAVNGNIGGTPGASASTATSAASAGSGGTFVQIVDNAALQVLASVNESDIANLKVGEPAQFTVSAYGNKVFHGTVSAISPNGQTVSNVVTYPVTIDVDMSNLQKLNLLPGMTASVTIDAVQRKNSLLIPVGAVNFARAAVTSARGSALISKQQASVALGQARQMLTQLESQNTDISADDPIPAYVIERTDNVFVVKPVVLGLTDETTYEVLAGLSADEVVVVGAQRG